MDAKHGKDGKDGFWSGMGGKELVACMHIAMAFFFSLFFYSSGLF